MVIEARSGWDWRPKLRWFAAEFLVVVTGVLVALALGALFDRKQDERSEDVYLSLLSRDLNRTILDLEEEVEFERLQLRDGIYAYKAISVLGPAAGPRASSALQRLTTRRTLMLQDGTYRDLISTGNLRLIENRELRDHIVDFFESTRRWFEVINKNNSFFVDEMYNGTLVTQGLIMPRAPLGNVPALAPLDSAVLDSLRAGYIDEPDRLWQLSPEAPEWAQVKSTLVSRIRVAALAHQAMNALLEQTRQLKRTIDAAR